MTQQTDIVVDTNIFVAAAFNPHSNSARIINGVRESRWRLRWNDFTRRENRQVVQTIPPIRSQWESAFAELFTDANKYTDFTAPNNFTSQIPDHPDREFAALADATGAVLITNDDDFLHVKEQLSVYVVTPGTFCHEFTCLSD